MTSPDRKSSLAVAFDLHLVWPRPLPGCFLNFDALLFLSLFVGHRVASGHVFGALRLPCASNLIDAWKIVTSVLGLVVLSVVVSIVVVVAVVVVVVVVVGVVVWNVVVFVFELAPARISLPSFPVVAAQFPPRTPTAATRHSLTSFDRATR